MKFSLLAGSSLATLLAAAGVANAGPVVFSSSTPGLASFTVATSGIYDILVKGAQGGIPLVLTVSGGSAGVAGLGGTESGDLALTAGEQLSIMVGGEGSTPSGLPAGGSAGGGGGSFVVAVTGNTPLAIAGGGGGGAFIPATKSAGTSAASGTGGAGGSVGAFSAGGGGFSGAGGSVAVPPPAGGASFLSGGAGGSGYYGANGGAGGGGGGGANGGGGGGGYNGGGGGYYAGVGGSGSNFLSALATNGTSTVGTNSGNGYVSITYLSAPVAAPEPGSAALLGAGLAGLAGAFVVRRRRLPGG